MFAKLRESKLAKLLEIEGYVRIEDLIRGRVLGCGLARHMHERRLQLHPRDGARPGRRLLRGMPHQHDEGGACSRRHI
jgi:hypothetical protein